MGGVVRYGLMERKTVFAFLIFTYISLILIIPISTAQEFELDTDEIIEIVFTFFFGPGFPSRWMTWKGLMQFIVFPFIAMAAVFYAIMEELHIFRSEGGKNAQKVIGIVMAFLAGKALLSTMRGFLIVNAWIATIMFGLMLLLGTFFWGLRGFAHHGIGGARRTWDEIKMLQKDIYGVNKELSEIQEAMDLNPPYEEMVKLQKKYKDKQEELKRKWKNLRDKKFKA